MEKNIDLLKEITEKLFALMSTDVKISVDYKKEDEVFVYFQRGIDL